MDNNLLIVIGIAVVAVIALLLLIVARRGRKAPAVGNEGDWVTDEAAAAVEDVIDQFIGVDAHHDVASDVAHGPSDELTTIKGLGPKAAARLHELGVTTYDQIARWSEGEVTAIDAQMGAFSGRIYRDKWVEQATFLAKGDTAGFEAKFGKLGG